MKRLNIMYSVREDGDVVSHLYNKEKLLKGLVKKDGYKQYFLKYNVQRRGKWMYAHRLVAQLYVPNPDNLPEVNHKDRNKLNNHYLNLEWCTHRYNIQHSFDTGRKTKTGADHWNTGKPVSEHTRAKMSEKRRLYWEIKRRKD